MTPKQQALQNKLEFAALHPVVDNMGKANLHATCKKFGLSSNHQLKLRLYKLLAPEVRKQRVVANGHDYSNRNGLTIYCGGLPFGEKTVALGWDVIQQPAVYAIVCRTSGRAFISSSIHPDKQRNVHFYWMQNWFRYGTSNTFFGNKKFIDDVKAYGIQDFYMEIIETYPNFTTAQVQQKAVEFLELHGLEMCYNRWIHTAYGGLMCQFYDIDEEVKKKTDEYHIKALHFEHLVEEHRKLYRKTIETRKNLMQSVKELKISSGEAQNLSERMSEVVNASRAERELAGAVMDISKVSLKKLVAEKKKFYKSNTEPF